MLTTYLKVSFTIDTPNYGQARDIFTAEMQKLGYKVTRLGVCPNKDYFDFSYNIGTGKNAVPHRTRVYKLAQAAK